MAKIETDHSKCWRECVAVRSLIRRWLISKMDWPLSKTEWQFLLGGRMRGVRGKERGREWGHRKGKRRGYQGEQETFGGNRSIHHLDRGDVFRVYTYNTTYQMLHFKHIKCFLLSLYFSMV